MSYPLYNNNTQLGFAPPQPQMVQAVRSCDKPGHFHHWVTTGELMIERCEHRCQFCTGDKAGKFWKSAWHLRRHIKEIHAGIDKTGTPKAFPDLIVSEGWEKKPEGNTRPVNKRRAAPGSNRKKNGTKLARQAASAAKKFAKSDNTAQPQQQLPQFSTMLDHTGGSIQVTHTPLMQRPTYLDFAGIPYDPNWVGPDTILNFALAERESEITMAELEDQIRQHVGPEIGHPYQAPLPSALPVQHTPPAAPVASYPQGPAAIIPTYMQAPVAPTTSYAHPIASYSQAAVPPMAHNSSQSAYHNYQYPIANNTTIIPRGFVEEIDKTLDAITTVNSSALTNNNVDADLFLTSNEQAQDLINYDVAPASDMSFLQTNYSDLSSDVLYQAHDMLTSEADIFDNASTIASPAVDPSNITRPTTQDGNNDTTSTSPVTETATFSDLFLTDDGMQDFGLSMEDMDTYGGGDSFNTTMDDFVNDWAYQS